MTPNFKIVALIAGFGLAALAGVAAFYPGKPAGGNTACAVPGPRDPAIDKAATGEVAGFKLASTSLDLNAISFNGADGKPMTLASFKGRTVLLNLWATWCVPCRKEMPALDTLQGEMGGPDFEVVAVNIDTRNPDKARDWLKDNKIERLAWHGDPEAKIFQDLKRMALAVGMPTTLLVDGQGCARGVLHGQAEWASNDAKALIRAALGK
jgi:thiol-disulfide isomerase/thioredoxin